MIVVIVQIVIDDTRFYMVLVLCYIKTIQARILEGKKDEVFVIY
jgi:hypothetical protein